MRICELSTFILMPLCQLLHMLARAKTLRSNKGLVSESCQSASHGVSPSDVVTACLSTGRDYEARLRSLHARMNPRTSWAAAPLERRRASVVQFGESSDEEE
jgi:hypothetical protein